MLFRVDPAYPQGQYEVARSDAAGGATSLPPQVMFDLRSASPSAQDALLPLYEREYALLKELSIVRWQALADTLGGLSAIAMSAAGIGSEAARVAEESAAKAGTPGAKFKGDDAVGSSIAPAEMYDSVNQAMSLVNQIQSIEEAISRTQKTHGILPGARTPWSILFGSSKILTPAEVTKLLDPAAKMVSVPPACKVYSDAINAQQQTNDGDAATLTAFGKGWSAQDIAKWNQMIAKNIERVGKLKKDLATCLAANH